MMLAGQIWSCKAPNGMVRGYRVTAVFPKEASVDGDCGFIWMSTVKPDANGHYWHYSYPAPGDTGMPEAVTGTWTLIEDVP